MRPGKIEGKTRPLGKPPNWEDDEQGRCGTLHVRDEIISGVPYMRSAWQPEDDEIGWMLTGSQIELGISGRQHPVVMLGVGPCPGESEPAYTVRTLYRPSGHRYIRVTMYAPRCGLEERLGGTCWAEAEIEGDVPFAEAVKKALEAIEPLAKEKKIV